MAINFATWACFSPARYDSKGQRLFFPEFDSPATNNGITSDTDYESYGSKGLCVSCQASWVRAWVSSWFQNEAVAHVFAVPHQIVGAPGVIEQVAVNSFG